LLSLNCLREYQVSLGVFKPRDGLGNYGETVRTLRFGLFHRGFVAQSQADLCNKALKISMICRNIGPVSNGEGYKKSEIHPI
jgi:hypothetical protein